MLESPDYFFRVREIGRLRQTREGLGTVRSGSRSSLGPRPFFCGGGKTAWYNLFDYPQKWGYRISPDSTRILNRVLPVTRLHIHIFYPCTLVYTITEYMR